jgi:ABC-2 type transport system ATP-binding protein
MTGPALVTQQLTKFYRTGHIVMGCRPALVGLDLTVERGEVFGYLGPNGSGKTTTLKLLMGLLRPDGGTAHMLGFELRDSRWRYKAGYLPEQPYFYDYLTAGEYVEYAGRILGLAAGERRARARALLEQVGLGQSYGVALRRFSKGMLQRLGLAQALVNDPEIVFLDEPMSGLDPLGRRLVRDIILDLKARGKTVFFSTHILPDAEALCDRVALLRGGRLLKSGRLDEILDLSVSHLEVLTSGGDLRGAPPPSGVRACRELGERARLEVDEAGLLPALDWARARGARILAVQPVRQSLEDYFMQEMGALPRGGAQWEQA